jgi:hypothetical protein
MLSNTYVLHRFLRSRLWGVFLIVLAWQGPIPICHAHGTLKSDPLATANLAAHLVQDHADLNLSADVFVDWHWHWVMPEDLIVRHTESCEIPGHPSASMTQETPVLIELPSVAFEPEQLLNPIESFIPHQVDLARSATERHHLPTSFLMTFASDLSLPERLSVFRC